MRYFRLSLHNKDAIVQTAFGFPQLAPLGRRGCVLCSTKGCKWASRLLDSLAEQSPVAQRLLLAAAPHLRRSLFPHRQLPQLGGGKGEATAERRPRQPPGLQARSSLELAAGARGQNSPGEVPAALNA